ncbi:MAG TPA: HAD family hydrolase [Armatimonadota bacterium]|jgi:pyrophosphatase PpaX
MFAGISTILFDLDGTVADTNDVILATIAETLQRETGHTWSREELLAHWGLKLRDQLLLLHPQINLARAVPFYRQCYQSHHQALLVEFPGVSALLAALHTRGLTLGIVTSKQRASAEDTLQSLGYRHYFSLLIAEEDTPRHKPSPDPLLLALERLGITAQHAIYIGDNPDDIIAAHAAGMPAVAVSWSLRQSHELHAVQPEAILEHPNDLLALLDAGAATPPVVGAFS